MACRIVARGSALTVLLCLGTGWSDGGFFSFSTTTHFAVESGSQRAVIVFEDGRETLILQTAYEGEQADFAWVIPTPVRVTGADFATGDPEVFTRLYQLTEPRGYYYYGGNHIGCLGCAGGSDEEGKDGEGGTPTVNVWEQFSVGDYGIAVLSAEESADLGGWLNANGYRVPDSANEVLQQYSAKGWYFVAVKLQAASGSRPSGGGGAGTASRLKPLELSFDTETPVFPMRISALSSPEDREISVLLYVIAPHRMVTANYPCNEVYTGGWDGSEFAAFYDVRFRSAMGSPPGFVVEYVGRSDGQKPWSPVLRSMLPIRPERPYYVTRLRTYWRRRDMRDDVILAPAEHDVEFDPTVSYYADATPRNIRLAGASLVVIGSVVTAARAPRRRRWRLALMMGLVIVLVV